MPSPTLSRATEADLPELLPLFAGYRAFYGAGPEPGREERFLRARLAHGESVVLLARRDGRATGFVQLYPLFSSVRMSRTWVLNDLYVEPTDRGAGTASALLAAAAAFGRADGAFELMLQTAHDNAPARALYERHGWVPDRVFAVYTLDLTPGPAQTPRG